MIKYIVTWVLTTVYTVPCPESQVVDEFGISPSYYVSCAVLHTSSIEETKTKEFYNKDSANAFYNRGKQQVVNYFSLGKNIKKIQIDSVLIND